MAYFKSIADIPVGCELGPNKIIFKHMMMIRC